MNMTAEQTQNRLWEWLFYIHLDIEFHWTCVSIPSGLHGSLNYKTLSRLLLHLKTKHNSLFCKPIVLFCFVFFRKITK